MPEFIKRKWYEMPVKRRWIAAVSFFIVAIFSLVVWATDSDQDGISKTYEDLFQLSDTNAMDATYDYDSDNLTNLAEFVRATDPWMADTDRDGWSDSVDDAPVSRFFWDLGEPLYFTGDDYHYTGPAWWLYAFKLDGTWQTNSPTAWHVDSTNADNVGSLSIEIDRSLLTNDAVLAVNLFDHSGASLYLDIYDTNDYVVGTNLFGNILTGTDQALTTKLSIPLASYQDAYGILMRRGTGEITVYETSLCVDEDGDGLDKEMEAQLGFSDNDTDSDDDGVSDYVESLASGSGYILREIWTNITGGAVVYLTSTSNYPALPDSTNLLTSLEGPVNSGDSYGTRIRGYLHAPQTGEYTFWVAADDTAELWLSTNQFAFNKVKIANVPSWTSSKQWNKYTNQQSVAISLVAGQKYYIEVLHKEGAGGDNIAVAWQGPGITQSIIGGAFLSLFVVDADNDGMSDDWELANGLDPTDDSDASSDSDEDGLNNLQEYQGGTDPQDVDSDDDGVSDYVETLASGDGSVLREVWTNISGTAVSYLTSYSNYPALPDYTNILSSFEAPSNDAESFGARIYGYLHAPQTGEYTFWVAADDTAELWFSTNQYSHDKVKIANVPSWTSSRQWNKYTNQQSVAISLQAGQKYYIEVLHKEGTYWDSASVAWQGPGITQCVIDGAFLSLYSSDVDADGMNDDWELGHGLNPADDSDASVDSDSDGLTNLQEYQGGTDPQSVDSDNDGVSDYVETLASGSGSILREVWTGIGGSSVSYLTSYSNYPALPDSTNILTSLEGPINDGDNFGARIRGYLHVPQTGEYMFWVASDDNSELWLSTDEFSLARGKVAYVSGYTSSRQWTKYTNQQSVAITLQAGQKYYIEVLHKEGAGGDNVAVAWQGPGITQTVVDGSFLSSFISDADADGMDDEWELVHGLDPTDDTDALIDSDGEGLINLQEYQGGTDPQDVDSDGDGVSDYVETLASGDGAILREVWTGITGNYVSDLTSYSNYPALPDSTNVLTSFEGPINEGDSYGARIQGYLNIPQTGDYTFWIASDDSSELWFSTNEFSLAKEKIAYVTGCTSSREWDKYTSQQSVVITLQAGQKYFVEVLHKEGAGYDNVAVAWRGPGITQTVIGGAFLSLYDPDIDDDGMNDDWELENGLDPTDDTDSSADSDGDGLTNIQEYQGGTNPQDIDSDDDGVSDYVETLSPGEGTILREVWTNVSGTAVSYLTSSTNYPILPDSTNFLSSLEGPIDISNDYGSRIYGYVHPPLSGDYTFSIAADDTAELWLSSSASSFEKLKIAYVQGWTSSREWDKYTNQQSVAITLQAGQKYFIEVLHKEGAGYDNVAVGWQGPQITNTVVIDGAFLSPPDESYSFYRTADSVSNVTLGLKYEYYEGSWTVLPDFDSLTPEYAGRVDTVNITPRATNDDFGFRFTGYVLAPVDGTYTFYTSSDDGSRLYIGSQEVVDNDGLHGMTEKYGFIGLKAGWHEITVVMFNATEYEGLTVRFKGPGIFKQSIPSEYLCVTEKTGCILREVWNDIEGNNLSALTSSTNYPHNPNSWHLLDSFEGPIDIANSYGAKIRGYLHPPTNGEYTFWVSGDDQCELWLSTDDSPSNLVKLASVPGYTAPRQWDKYTNQQSVAITLQAGLKYYIEALHKEGAGWDNVAVAWQGPGITNATLISGSYLSPCVLDADVDGMLDDWELANGLDPTDASDASLDADNDELNNLQEYLSGSDINDSDTDNDGISDYAEVYSYGTDPALADTDRDGISDIEEISLGLQPTVSDIGVDPDGDWLDNVGEYKAGTDFFDPDTDGDGMDDGWEVYISSDANSVDFSDLDAPLASISINPATPSVTFGDWTVLGSNMIQAVSYRGYVDYSFEVTMPHAYMIEVYGTQAVENAEADTLCVMSYVDDKYLGQWKIDPDHWNGSARFLSPWLTNGEHTLRVFWDNIFTNSSLRVTEISLKAFDGPDADEDGMPDWLNHRFDNVSTLDTILSSKVSPVCIEGKAVFPGMMDINIDNVEIKHGAGNRWYADVPLSASNSTEVVVSWQDRAKTITNTVEWLPFNILDEEQIAVRLGDSLLLSVSAEGVTNSAALIDIQGVTNYATTTGIPVVQTFNESGEYTIIGTCDALPGVIGTARVSVVSASFPTNSPIVWHKQTTKFSNPDIPASGVVIEGGENVMIGDLNALGGGIQYDLSLEDVDSDQYLVVRVGDSGDILDSVRVNGMWLHARIGGLRIIEELPDRSLVVENRIATGYFPDSCHIKIDIFAGGAVFEDGTTELTIESNELDELGGTTYRMIVPAGGVVCNRVYVYEGSLNLGDI